MFLFSVYAPKAMVSSPFLQPFFVAEESLYSSHPHFMLALEFLFELKVKLCRVKFVEWTTPGITDEIAKIRFEKY